MLNQLMELVRDSGQQTVVQNPAVPNEQNEAVLQEASSSIYGGMQQLMQTGGAGALKSLFQGAEQGDMQNPAVQQVANQFSGNLTQKFGFDAGTAKSIAISMIPMVLGKLLNRSRTGGDSGFGIGDILGSLMGGGQQAGAGQPQAGGGMMGNLSNMGTRLGLDKDGDGDTDLKDLMGMFGK